MGARKLRFLSRVCVGCNVWHGMLGFRNVVDTPNIVSLICNAKFSQCGFLRDGKSV